MNGPIHYRLADSWSEGGDVLVELTRYHVLRETPCGYWVISDYYHRHAVSFPDWPEKNKRWVPKQGSRFCHSTLEAAANHYALRKRKEVRHALYRLAKVKHVLDNLPKLNHEALLGDEYQNLDHPHNFVAKLEDLLR